MGSLISGLSGGGLSGLTGDLGGVSGAENTLLGTQSQDEISMMQTEGAQDQMQTAAQQTTSWANTMNTIAKEFQDVTQSKDQNNAAVAKEYSDETKQA